MLTGASPPKPLATGFTGGTLPAAQGGFCGQAPSSPAVDGIGGDSVWPQGANAVATRR